MPENRSEEYYFQRGDVVLRVENTTFKLHKDILERHSGFLRDMSSMPPFDVTEGTDDNPLHLPPDLCSLTSFKCLCKLMYPSVMGDLPSISVALLDIWEPVLKATTALQMGDTRTFIFTRLAKGYTPFYSPRILALCFQFDDAPGSLKSSCFRTLAYRRWPISLEETIVMGVELAHQVGYIREKIRSLIGSGSGLLIGIHKLCTSQETCKATIARLIRDNLWPRASDKDNWSEIFDIQGPPDPGLCSLCALYRNEYTGVLKSVSLNKVVDDCLLLLCKEDAGSN